MQTLPMNWRLALPLFLLTLPGCAAMAWLALPLLVDSSKLTLPLPTLQVATFVQSALLAALATATGTLLHRQVGLTAPVISATVTSGHVAAAMRPLLLPGILGGLAGAAVIVGFHAWAPAALAAVQGNTTLPLTVRLLYGGITEELLLRWGVMTLVVWLGWKMLQRDTAPPSSRVFWAGITLTALVFGLSHIPAAAAAMGTVPAAIVAYITLGNALFGMVAGYLFWRYGLEAAMIAHTVAHLVAFALRG